MKDTLCNFCPQNMAPKTSYRVAICLSGNTATEFARYCIVSWLSLVHFGHKQIFCTPTSYWEKMLFTLQYNSQSCEQKMLFYYINRISPNSASGSRVWDPCSNFCWRVTRAMINIIWALVYFSGPWKKYVFSTHGARWLIRIQSNLCTTTTLGTPNLWPLLTGVRCSEVV